MIFFLMLMALLSTAHSKSQILIASFTANDSSLSEHSIRLAKAVIARDTNYALINLQQDRTEESKLLNFEFIDSSALSIGKQLGAKFVLVGAANVVLGDTVLSLKLYSIDSSRIAKISISSIQSGQYDSYEFMLIHSVADLIQTHKWIKSSHGFGLTFGFGGSFYDAKTTTYLGNHGGANAQFDILSGPIALKLKGSVWTINLEKDISISGINYTQGDKINPATGTIAIGWVKQLSDDIYTIPYAGLTTFSLNYIDKDDSKKKDLPTAYGFTVGNSIDYVFYSSNPNDFMGYTVRLDMGFSSTSNYKISGSFGEQLYFFSLTIGAFGYGSKFK